jgi:hypothetical protein
MTFVCGVVGGVVLLHFVRSRPETVHEYCRNLSNWQRIPFIFALCVGFAFAVFGYLSPRFNHLKYIRSHPPAWFAILVALFFIGLWDVCFGITPTVYAASFVEWFGYVAGAIAVVVVYDRLTNSKANDDAPTDRQSPANLYDWHSLDVWLPSDAPAEYDFLGNHAVAKRLKNMLATGTHSIGLVGPFGCGKTSVIDWIARLVVDDEANDGSFLLLSKHNCWGFETSATSIHSMLEDGIAIVTDHIDTLRVRSLPESYRQTFSIGGDWLDKLSKVFIPLSNPTKQFQSLSRLLGEMKARLVFIVEDLDRNTSRTFDVYEVLAFLQQLKGFENISFVLTGGLQAQPRIDFAKLCDHIEPLKTIDVDDSSRLICILRERCFDQSVFPHEVLTVPEQNEWKSLTWKYLGDWNRLIPVVAVAQLLTTPRALRHAMARTYQAWLTLCGEIDWDHLFAVNTLIHAAPEAFSFVLRHWHRLHDYPSSSSQQYGQMEQIQKMLQSEWADTVRGVEWNAKAVRALIDFILPVTTVWMDGSTHIESGGSGRLQGIQGERYWQRAMSQVIGEAEVRDQVVIGDIKAWLTLPSTESAVVKGICSSSEYGDVWLAFVRRFLPSDAERKLLLCQQVLSHLCQTEGNKASSESQGIGVIWKFVNGCVEPVVRNREWLEERIEDAASVSLQMVVDLWHEWGSIRCVFLRRNGDHADLRNNVLRILQKHLKDADALDRVLHPQHHYVIYQLVFDPGVNGRSELVMSEWMWLATILLDGLRQNRASIALEVCHLIVEHQQDRWQNLFKVDVAILTSFFGDNTREVIEIIERLCKNVESQEQLIVDGVVQSARVAFPKREEGNEQKTEQGGETSEEVARLLTLPVSESIDQQLHTFVETHAWRLYVGRGRANGNDLQDWFNARVQLGLPHTRWV